MTLQLAIIADDLTGALDAASPFAGAGLRVQVATRPAALLRAMVGSDVVALSTRSRAMNDEDARQVVADVLAALPLGLRLFKKVDSRLKGPVAAELSAFGGVPMLVVPALPEFGRIVRAGAVLGHGVDQPIAIAPRLGASVAQALVPDVDTPEAMLRAVLGSNRLIVGARAAADALATGLAGAARRAPQGLQRPVLIVVGSTDPITLAQVAHLRHALPDARIIAAPDGVAVAGPAAGVSLVQATPGQRATAAQVEAALARTVRPLAQAARSLILTGGATAESVLDDLGIDLLQVCGDVLPGMPLSVAGQWRIVTKSGGFGTADTLEVLARGAE